MTDEKSRRRWISLGEMIALAALIVSALGLWLSWQGSQHNEPTRIVEQRQAIPLVLRGTVQGDGRELVIAPVESSHALESMIVTLPRGGRVELSGDGRLSARQLESSLKDREDEKGSRSVRANISANYVEMGKERRSSGSYSIRYRWEGGGLFDSRSLRIEGFSRG